MRISSVITNNPNPFLSENSKQSEVGDFQEIFEAKNKSNKSAKEFLYTLSPTELVRIQKANNLACAIIINDLSDEGAENLFNGLIDRSKLVDLNNDGIVEIGAAKSFIFPPPNAPESVKRAWEETTSGLTFKEIVLLKGKMLLKQFEANSYIDANGNCRVYEPGAPGWVNIFGETNEAYIKLFNDLIYRIDNPLSYRDENQQKLDQLARDVFSEIIKLID